jgi:hypothetical protein
VLGWVAVAWLRFGGPALFALVAAAGAAFGTLIVASMLLGVWNHGTT